LADFGRADFTAARCGGNVAASECKHEGKRGPMILSLLGSKVGVVIVALALCAAFIGFSKWKHRTHPKDATIRIARTAASRANESASLASRAQDNAIARAEDARVDRSQNGAKGESFDDAGNVYRRRAVPEPMPSSANNAANGFAHSDDAVSLDDEATPVTSLRIHGRRAHDSAEGTPKLLEPLKGLFAKTAKAVEKISPAVSAESKQAKPSRFVPFGRLIKAELVITLESTQDEMPLIGLITEPIFNNGKLVIPAGTELHSMARPDRVRDRIVSTTEWRLIFPREGNKPNGRQLVFDGIALDREDRDGNGLTWGLTDGSYGLRGRAIHSGQTTEALMLFAAEAIKAGSASLMDRQETLLGSQIQENARNASLAGGQAVLSHFAESIAKELERNGTYIQVPAGKEFYVYPRQVIDPDRADIPDNLARVE
jgi:hypothetical protein